VWHGQGGDGTVGSNKNTVQIIGQKTGFEAQAYFYYDSKKAGSQTISHLRFGPERIEAPYYIQKANFVACHLFSDLNKNDMLEYAAHGTPCRGGVPPLTAQQAEELRGQSPEWALVDDAHRIERTFRFRDFREALTFVQKVGEVAETEGHHPDISFGWGYATVSLRTKKIKGLHENDFIMATKIDQLALPPNG